MKAIIKHGEDSFVVKCPLCGCEFTYQQEDIQKQELLGVTMNMSVQCPECEHIVPHNASMPYKQEDIVHKIMIVKERRQEANNGETI